MSGWREALSDLEELKLNDIERQQDKCRETLRALAKGKREIMNRAIQRKKYRSHQKLGVDMDAATP